jgi:hypothetical protein
MIWMAATASRRSGSVAKIRVCVQGARRPVANRIHESLEAALARKRVVL